MKKTSIVVGTICLMLVFNLLAFGKHMGMEEKDIVDTAMAAGSFSTLCAALEAAELVDVLKGEGPFTVFAPNDDAFAALPEGELDRLLMPENKAELQGILKHHVLSGKFMSDEVAKMASAETLNGDEVEISVNDEDDTVMVGGATVISADIKCSNGVIHAIDAVLIP